jgi:hypothetical protein
VILMLPAFQVKWDVYKHYLKSIGIVLSLATIFLNMVFQGFSIGSNIWLSKWSSDPEANQTNVRDMYLGVYGAFGVGQGKRSEFEFHPLYTSHRNSLLVHSHIFWSFFFPVLLKVVNLLYFFLLCLTS